MKRQDMFLIGCLLTGLSFLYFESSSFDFQPVNSLSDPVVRREQATKVASSSSMKNKEVVEKEVAAVE